MSWSSFATMAPCRLRIWHGLHHGQNIKALMKAPLGRVQQTLPADWVLGPMSVNVSETCGYCDCPCAPRDLHNTTLFTQHDPTFSPRTQFAWSHGTTLAGVIRHLMLRPLKHLCQSLSLQGAVPPDETTQASLGWWLGTVGAMCRCREHPWAPVCSEHPHSSNFKPHCQPKGTVLWSFLGAMAPCKLSLSLQGAKAPKKTTHFIHHFQFNQNGTAHAKSNSPTYA